MSDTPHRLDPLLRPESIALVGASPREGSYSRRVYDGLVEGGYAGAIYLVNPRYEEILGRPCYPDFESLPDVPDHAVLVLANERLLAAMQAAADSGIRAVTIYGSCHLNDGDPVPLKDRLQQIAEQNGMQVCGGNGMGFYNRDDEICLQLANIGGREPPGKVAFITHSGSVLMAYCHNQTKVRFNLSVSAGQEFTTTAADYLDFALTMESTRVACLFIETVRDPEGFIAALQKAASRNIPVVVCKVARSEAAIAFAVTHTGALAGDSAVFDAVCDRYGVLRVDDLDEMMATVQLLSMDKPVAPSGGMMALLDSGGERELLADTADQFGLGFPQITGKTRRRMVELLDDGFEAENPIDAWGSGHDYEQQFQECMNILLADDNAAVGVWVADLCDRFWVHEGYCRAAEAVAASTDKPLVFATCYSQAEHLAMTVRLLEAGIPVLDGIRPAMAAVAAAFRYRAFRQRPAPMHAEPTEDRVEAWQARLASGEGLDENEGLALLSDFGVAVVRRQIATSQEQAVEAADSLGYPVVLKTAMPGIDHKSDRGGVVLGLASASDVADAYDRMSAALGNRVMVAETAPAGIEMALGIFQDPQFGPIVMLGAGGTLVEVLNDAVFAVPPFDKAEAGRLIDRLRSRKILDGVRGQPAVAIDALAEAAANLSVLAVALGPVLQALDVNPIIVNQTGAVAVDALVAVRKGDQKDD
ncbi:MAG: acetate--CoA ligase family protein [Alphaproteobacteria bacterium]